MSPQHRAYDPQWVENALKRCADAAGMTVPEYEEYLAALAASIRPECGHLCGLVSTPAGWHCSDCGGVFRLEPL